MAVTQRISGTHNTIYDCGDHLEVEATKTGVADPVRFKCSREDLELARGRKWTVTKDGYAYGSGRYFHKCVAGSVPSGSSVDHISRDRLDNRRENLRVASATVQNINKNPAPSATLPRGVRHNATAAAYCASVSESGRRDEVSFPEARYGTHGARVAAMHARMWMMINGDAFIEGKFHPSVINPTLARYGLEVLPESASVPEIRSRLVALHLMGLNLWTLQDGGKFASLVTESVPWSMDETRGVLVRLSVSATEKLVAARSDRDLPSACVALEGRVRAELESVVGRVADPRPIASGRESIVTDPRLAMRMVSEATRLVPEEVGRRVGQRMVRLELNSTLGRFVALVSRLVADGKVEEVESVLHRGVRSLEAIVSDSTEEIEVGRKRVYTPSAMTVEWVRDHVRPVAGSLLHPETLMAEYGRWCAANGDGVVDGKSKVYQAMTDAGYRKKAVTSFVNAAMIE